MARIKSRGQKSGLRSLCFSAVGSQEQEPRAEPRAKYSRSEIHPASRLLMNAVQHDLETKETEENPISQNNRLNVDGSTSTSTMSPIGLTHDRKAGFISLFKRQHLDFSALSGVGPSFKRNLKIPLPSQTIVIPILSSFDSRIDSDEKKGLSSEG